MKPMRLNPVIRWRWWDWTARCGCCFERTGIIFVRRSQLTRKKAHLHQQHHSDALLCCVLLAEQTALCYTQLYRGITNSSSILSKIKVVGKTGKIKAEWRWGRRKHQGQWGEKFLAFHFGQVKVVNRLKTKNEEKRKIQSEKKIKIRIVEENWIEFSLFYLRCGNRKGQSYIGDIKSSK